MKRIYSIALLTTLAAAPVTLEAQNPSAPRAQEQADRRQDGARPEMLLQLRDQLGLTTEQVSRLESIRQRLQQQNAPLIEQLRASGAWQERRAEGEARSRERGGMTPEHREQMRQRMQNATPEQREAMRRQMQERREQGERGPRAQRDIPEELRPVVRQIQENTRGALQEARGVLTAAQQTRLRELVQQRRGATTGREGQLRDRRGSRGIR